MFNFKKLEVWQKSVAFAGTIYRSTAQFPADKRFGLASQIRRAATSISSNIAEGSARPPDYARFLGYASGSLYEIVTQAKIAPNEPYLGGDRFRAFVSRCRGNFPHVERFA